MWTDCLRLSPLVLVSEMRFLSAGPLGIRCGTRVDRAREMIQTTGNFDRRGRGERKRGGHAGEAMNKVSGSRGLPLEKVGNKASCRFVTGRLRGGIS